MKHNNGRRTLHFPYWNNSTHYTKSNYNNIFLGTVLYCIVYYHMAKTEYCKYRNIERQDNQNFATIMEFGFGNSQTRNCQALIEKGASDVICHNLDLNQSTCRLSPEYDGEE